MHRLIREKWKPFGGRGHHFTGGPLFKDIRTKSGPPTISEKGQSHGTEGNVLPAGPGLVGPLGTRSCPSLPAWALTPVGKRRGVLLAVLLPQSARPHTGPSSTLPHCRGGTPTRQDLLGGPSSHRWCSRTPFAWRDGLDQLCVQGQRRGQKTNQNTATRAALQETTLLLEVMAEARPCALSGQGSPNLHEPRSPNRGSRRLWGPELGFPKLPLQLLPPAFWLGTALHWWRFVQLSFRQLSPVFEWLLRRQL